MNKLKHSVLLSAAALLALSISAHADAQPSISSYLCPAQCNGMKKVAPFDFKKKAQAYGDPNDPSGKTPLGANFLTPKTEDNSTNDDVTPGEQAPTGTALAQLESFENWSAQNCGTSLNDSGDVKVAGMCPGTKAIYDRWKFNMVNKHQKTSPFHAPANKKAMDDFFNLANSPAAKEKLKTHIWFRNDGVRTHFVNCKTEGLPPVDKNLFAVEISGTMCSILDAPKTNAFAHPGLPVGSSTGADSAGKASVHVFGKEFVIISGVNSVRSPGEGNVNRTTQITYLTEMKVNDLNIQQAAMVYDNTLQLESVHESQSATFTVGPVPITVEGGIDGQAGVGLMARGTKMWANTRMTPYAKLDGFARAYVNLFVIKAGVQATIVLFHDLLDIYAFSGVLATDVNFSGTVGPSFIYSQQISLINTIKALNGSVDAFVKVAVPKFIGWKWKKYTTNIFSWGGIEASGYLYNNASDAVFIRNVPNTP